jgi:hypothetical protein
MHAKNLARLWQVKPSNILLNNDPDNTLFLNGVPPLKAWLADVGAAKADAQAAPGPHGGGGQRTHLSTTSIKGTPGFVDSLVVNGLQHSEATDGFALGVTLLMALTGKPAVGLTHTCSPLLRAPDDVEAWAMLLDGEWPRHVAAACAAVAWGLTMPQFKEDRLPIPEARRRIEAALASIESADGAAATPPPAAPAAAPPAADTELRSCIVCDDAPRECRFHCGHACCCARCADLIANTGGRCPICRGASHPLLASGEQVGGAPTFEL